MKNMLISEAGNLFTRMALSGSCEVNMKDGCIWAIPYDDNEREMLIHVVPRMLGENETEIIRIPRNAISKLEYKVDQMIDSVVPSVSFVVFKRSLADCELVVIPLDEIRKNSSKGGTFNETERGMFYNPSSKHDSDKIKPKGSYLHAVFKHTVKM